MSDEDPPDGDAVGEHPGRAEHGEDRHPRTGETASERHTRQLSELLMETRVSAVGIQVIIGFLLAVPFQATLEGMGRSAYVVSIMSGMLATALLLAPSILHRALLHRARKRCLEVARRNVLLAGKHAFRNAAVEDVFPEDPSRRADRQAIFNPVAVACGKAGQAAIRRRNERFKP